MVALSWAKPQPPDDAAEGAEDKWIQADGLRDYLAKLDSRFAPGHLADGIVFHHPDGRRAKIKRRDFA
ncbi:hypothetical protein [Actinomadura sp. WMMA1423]|uniref:hypothetical protein n=1 Tax=Actinomadura sp. WMMA1423 TaxID=2591108 RepID=UPI001146D10A|nr:hypothetical protein [Actinomadura sp. WMMA1423]